MVEAIKNKQYHNLEFEYERHVILNKMHWGKW